MCSDKKKYKQCGIYCYHNIINGKNYIGQSINLTGRRKDFHTRKRYSGNIFQNALDKYGKENFQYSILTHCKREELNYWESFYIERLKTTDRKYGYNATSGGDSRFNVMMDSKESLYKRVFCYNKNGDLVKVYKSVASTQEDGFEKHQVVHCCSKKDIERTHKGHVFSYEELTKENVLKLFEKHVKKPVIQLSLRGEFIKEWESAALAGRELCLSFGNISKCCKHKVYKCGDYIWLFKEEYDEKSHDGKIEIADPNPPNAKTVKLIDFNGNVIKTYASHRLASKELNIKEGSFYHYLSEHKPVMGKYYLCE